MFKRPNPTIRYGGSHLADSLDINSLKQLLRAPHPLPLKKKMTSPTGHMYPNQGDWLLRRSELTCEKRDEFFREFQAGGDTDKYLKDIHMLPSVEPDILIPPAKQVATYQVFWGFINVVLRVEDDQVRVHIDTKLGEIYAKYFNKAKKPPLRPYAEALMSAGYPPEKINRVIDNYVWWKKNKQVMQDEFERLYPPEKKKGIVVVKKVFKPVVKKLV